MPFATVVSLIGLATVLFAVYRDRTVLERGPAGPDWDALPAPADLGHTTFPLAVPGYDPAAVDIHLDRLRRAYTDLYVAAPDEVRAAARPPSAAAPDDVGAAPPPPASRDEAPAPVVGRDDEATPGRPGGQDPA